jgi:hypothetical protein
MILPLDLTEFDTHKAAVERVLQHFERVSVVATVLQFLHPKLNNIDKKFLW